MKSKDSKGKKFENKLFISIDPGRKNLISALTQPWISSEKETQKREYRCSQLNRSNTISNEKLSKNQKRKRAKRNKLFITNQREYELTNKRYYEMCGFTKRAKKLEYWKQKYGIDKLDTQLGQDGASCRTFDPGTYLQYVKYALNYNLWSKYWSFVELPCHQKERFQVYQKQQHAYYQIAHELCFWKTDVFKDTNTNTNRNQSYWQSKDTQYSTGKENKFRNGVSLSFNNFIVLWGDGSFGPTATGHRGHAAAPNKGLRLGLSKYLQIYLVSEYNTSKKSSCCRENSKYAKLAKEHVGCSKKRKHEENEKRLNRVGDQSRDLLYCSMCDMPWRRDVNSSRNIFSRFRDRVYTDVIPSCFSRS
jgi:hypothetical protein